MIIIKLDGGMGNQLFQYALGKSLALKLNAELKFDTHLFTPANKRQYSLHHFGIEEKISSISEKQSLEGKEYVRRQLNKLGFRLKPYWYTEHNAGYDKFVDQLTDNVYIEGFWQTEKYFKPIEESIRKQLKVKDPISAVNAEYLREIIGVNAISLHVRRGDYITDKVTSEVHGVCDIEYYRQAIDLIGKKIEQPHFYIFSDDMEWTKANLSVHPFPATYIENNIDAPQDDLRLMYSCKHHIIANSSFSWWGAWLGDAPNKMVIAPKKWFRSLENDDIIPPKWISI